MLLRCLIRSRETMQLGKAYPGEGRHHVPARSSPGSRPARKTEELARLSGRVRDASARTTAKGTGLLSVALGTKPRDLAIAVHPLVNLGLTFETGDFSWFKAGVLSDDSPVIFRVTLWAEGYFCFCHGAL
jgi:hypothetical protein